MHEFFHIELRILHKFIVNTAALNLQKPKIRILE